MIRFIPCELNSRSECLNQIGFLRIQSRIRGLCDFRQSQLSGQSVCFCCFVSVPVGQPSQCSLPPQSNRPAIELSLYIAKSQERIRKGTGMNFSSTKLSPANFCGGLKSFCFQMSRETGFPVIGNVPYSDNNCNTDDHCQKSKKNLFSQ